MRLPRWTTYPALAAIAALLWMGVPRPTSHGLEDAARPGAPRETTYPRMVVLGIDGMDPEILQQTIERYPERMRNFSALIAEGGLHSLGTSTPPQSPVAWSNFITGLNPGGHGIFDFIHRDPVTRLPISSTTKSEHGSTLHLPGEWKFPLGGDSSSNRTGEAFWTILAKRGVPADIWRMPANFPVEKAKGLSFSGMMTPAIDSAYGQFTFYSTDIPTGPFTGDSKIVPVKPFDGRITTRLQGVPNAFKEGDPEVEIPLMIYLDVENNAAAIDTGSAVIVLEAGEWSDFTTVTFGMLPAGMMDVSGLVRFYLRSVAPEFEMYASAINIDPVKPITPVSEPASASAAVADRRTGIGPYYTQGMPEDVNAVKSEVLTVPEFMQQTGLVHTEGERMLDYALDHYLDKPDGGFLFFYFSTVDLCMHMMWRHGDPAHPHYDPELAAESSEAWSGRPGSQWKDVTGDLYMKMDAVLGHLRSRIGPDTTLVVMSDHGFAPYHRKFSLNTWLFEEGYLVLEPDKDREDEQGSQPVYIYGDVDWAKTRAYGVGFNGLYLNLKGRELNDPSTEEDEAGIVDKSEAAALLAEIKGKLEALIDPKTGERVVLRADLAGDVYSGERLAEAPDMLVGYNSGYDNSDESAQGRVTHSVLADNLGGTFNGSHLMAPEVVPGILLSNRRVLPGEHDLTDLTVEILKHYGIEPADGMLGSAVLEKP